MAKPKEKHLQLSAAFEEKCSKEEDKLKKKLAQQLKADIERMLEEDIHSDLEFKLKGGYSVGHRLILKSRSRNLWERLCEGRSVEDARFHLSHLDKAVFDASLFQVYGSENADIAAEELMAAMEDRGDDSRDVGPLLNDERRSEDSLVAEGAGVMGVELPLWAEGGVSNDDLLNTDEVPQGREQGTYEHRVPMNNANDVMGVGGAQGGLPVHYNLDMISSAHFAAGQDFVAADASSLFVLPNGQEINNNDANNNGVDANQLVPNQNLPRAPQPRVVNLEPQVLDLVSHGVVPPNSAPVSLLADIQIQERFGAVGGASALSTLPDVIKTSYCSALPYDTCSRLGEELLRALLQEMDTDCTLSVGGQELKCHRCILASRSNYFTAMLRGGWVESEGDKIVLECVSPSVVQQALLYIYGGVIDLTDSCNVSELLVLSDMYGLDGLKEVISLHLRMNNCHFFHKPCPQCIPGVIETLTIVEHFRLEELADRCRKWINKNFVKVWPTKTFAQLPETSLQLCCRIAIEDLQPHSVLDVIMDCDKLTTSLPRLKWTEPVLDLITLLMDSAMEFTSQNFSNVLSSERFIALGKSQAWSMSLLDTIFTTVIKSLPIDSICKTYLAVVNLVEFTEDETCSWTEDFKDFLKSLLEKCKSYIRLYIHQVVHCQQWEFLTKSMQKDLLESASYVCIDAHRGKVPPKLSSMNKKSVKQLVTKCRPVPKCSSQTAPKRQNSSHSMKYPNQPTSSSRSLPSSLSKQNTSSAGVSGGKESSKGSEFHSTSSIPRPIRNVTSDNNHKVNVRKIREGSGAKLKDMSSPADTFLQTKDVDNDLAVNSSSALCFRLRQRSGSAGDVPVTRMGVSRSRSEELHLLRKGENHVFELLPIFETKFTVPEDPCTLSSDSF